MDRGGASEGRLALHQHRGQREAFISLSVQHLTRKFRIYSLLYFRWMPYALRRAAILEGGMSNSWNWSPEARLKYVRDTAERSIFRDSQRSSPKFILPFDHPLPDLVWRVFHDQFSFFVDTNLRTFPNLSDENWQRLTRMQFAILDQDLVDDSFGSDSVQKFINRQEFKLAARRVCEQLRDNGWCISAKRSDGSAFTLGSPWMPGGSGTPLVG